MQQASTQLTHEDVRAFVEEVLRTGLVLTDLLGNLLEDLPEDAYPGENPAEVLIEMVAGSIKPVADAAGVRAVHDSRALLAALLDRTLADLRTAASRARPT